MVDIHCHVLPGVDDGSPDWDTTIAMCRLAHQDGIAHVVATPHANSRYAYSREIHSRTLEELRLRCPEMTFSLGCDLYCSYENVQHALTYPENYAIGNTSYLLLEFGEFTTIHQMSDIVRRFAQIGHRSIITHPERLQVTRETPDFGNALVNAGAYIQITANSLTGFWGVDVQQTSERLLQGGLVSIIASDAHGTRRRAPVLSQAWAVAAELIGAERARRLVAENPAAVIANSPLA